MSGPSAAASFIAFDQTEALTLGFGKHRSTPLSEIETSYLEWVKSADRITPALLTAIEAELASRASSKPVKDRYRAPQGVPDAITNAARMIIELGVDEVRRLIPNDYRVDAAEELLKFAVSMIELESDPGSLPF